MSGNAILLFPYEIDWFGRDEAKQALLRGFLAHGADLRRELVGPSLSRSRPRASAQEKLAFDVDVSRFVERVRRLPGFSAEPLPSAQYRPPAAVVVIAHDDNFDQRVVQLIQRLVSAAPLIEGSAFVLLCDFAENRKLLSAIRTYGELDRADPLQLPILTLSATKSRLLVVSHGIPYPAPELIGRLRDVLTPVRQRTGPRPSASEPAFPTVSISVPRRDSSEMPKFVLDPALRTGEDKK